MHATPNATPSASSAKMPFGTTGWMASPLGFGTYRVSTESPQDEHRLALRQALLSGINLIDTSANYMNGLSEQLIGEVIEELITTNQISREEIILVSKGGYVQSQNMEMAKLRREQNHPFPEMVHFSPECWHCIHPEYLHNQITQSLSRLRCQTIDVYLLHNPEYFLKSEPDFNEYYRRIRNAFVFLKEEAERGRIHYFGVSSNTFVDPKESDAFTSLETLLEIAAEIGCENLFKVIQFPLNLREPGALLEKNNSSLSVLELAKSRGLATLINRPLNALTEQSVLRLKSYPKSDQSKEKIEEKLQETLLPLLQLETHTDDSTIAWGHILKKNFHQIHDPENWQQLLHYRILPSLEQAFKQLETHPQFASQWAPWIDEYRFRSEEFFEAVTQYFTVNQAKISDHLAHLLDEEAPELVSSSTLSQKALRLYLSLTGVNCVLLGMRKPSYVEDGLAVIRTIQKEGLVPLDFARRALEKIALTDLSHYK